MTNSLICQGTTKDCVDFFDKRIETFGPVEKVFCFFESANFLLLPYNIDSDFVHMVLENTSGKTMQLTGMSCGYDGAGSDNTAYVLMYLGLSKDEAMQAVKHCGLQIHFISAQHYYEISHNVFFQTCLPDSSTKVSIIRRTICFLEPDKSNLNGFLNCLKVMSPLRVDFALGGKQIQDNAPRSGDVINKYISESKGLSKNLPLNVIVYGKKFDLHCFVSKKNILVFIKLLQRYFKADDPFLFRGKGSIEVRSIE